MSSFGHLAGTVADNYFVDFGLVAILLVEAGLGSGDESRKKLVLHQVDGATTETAAHDTRTDDTAFLGHIVEEVELLAAHLIVLRKAMVSLVHATAYGIVVAGHKCVAHGEDTLFLFNNELCTEVVLGGDVALTRELKPSIGKKAFSTNGAGKWEVII